MRFFDEVMMNGHLVVVGDFCSWYSYNGLEYVLTYKYERCYEFDNSDEANEIFEQFEKLYNC